MTFITLHDIVKVRGRFHRSVQLARDWADRRNLSEYLLMPTTRDLASRILQNIQAPQGVKAWSITGPYGTGKSAFALFLTDLLSQDLPDHPQAKVLRCELKFQMSPILPVLMVGERAPLIPAFLSTLAASMLPIAPSLAETVKHVAQTSRISDSDIVALVTQSARVAKQAGYGGLLIVMDEFGKFLEYLSLHPEADDLLVMQHLAEAVTRSTIPIVLITILHTSFAEYLPQTNEAQRMEWQKVQGRFADVAFQEPPGQLLKLIGAAIQRQMPSELEIAYLETVNRVVSSSALSEAHRRFPLEELLSDCVPLHPITALLLWPIFRGKLAQNERSLFAFLTGMEPFGFQEFLSLTAWSGEQPPFYRVDQLYDYVITVLGSMTYTGDRAHRWAEIDHAICRIPADGPPLSQAIVKVVGLVGLYGAAIGLKASEEIISIALDTSEDVSAALSYLEHSSILLFRRFEGAYGLWEGSDIDVDKCFEEARRHVGQGNISVRLKGAMPLRPLVARAHHIKTGTLRYFSVDVIDGAEQNLRQAFDSAARSADGQVIYVLTSHLEDRRSLIELARMLTDEGFAKSNLNILAFPKPIVGLEEALFEVEAWRWVMENVQALQGDVVGRREVKVRLLEAEKRLEGTVGRIFGLGGERFDPATSEWVQGGNIHHPQSPKGFSRWLSDLCDAIFNRAPSLHNELINRDRLSSAAAKARRNLLEAMLTREREPDLGFKGTPAEVSIYRTLLSASGFHRFRDGQLGFGEPGGEWSFVWHEIHQFLKTTRTSRRSIKDLFSVLKRPPLGFRDGPLPILLCVVLLVQPRGNSAGV
jgi:hypothetical protein